jgi:ribonuclease T1
MTRLLTACGLALLMGWASSAALNPVWAKAPNTQASNALVGKTPAGMGTISLAELPKQGRDTYSQILAGGPFPYDKDGTVFGNRERILPKEKRGYYREYTVKTPFSRTRGARRIVCGGLKPAAPEACYYTADHYSSFQHIVP